MVALRVISLLPVALLLTNVFATPIAPLEVRAVAATTCGSNKYTVSQVTAAYKKGYTYYEDDDEAGSSDYPHTYENYEGFDFPVKGPYQEFPIKESGVYTGGSPGADRVIFSTSGSYAGTITHTGASGDDFVGCTGTST